MEIAINDITYPFQPWRPELGQVFRSPYSFDSETTLIDDERPWICTGLRPGCRIRRHQRLLYPSRARRRLLRRPPEPAGRDAQRAVRPVGDQCRSAIPGHLQLDRQPTSSGTRSCCTAATCSPPRGTRHRTRARARWSTAPTDILASRCRRTSSTRAASLCGTVVWAVAASRSR